MKLQRGQGSGCKTIYHSQEKSFTGSGFPQNTGGPGRVNTGQRHECQIHTDSSHGDSKTATRSSLFLTTYPRSPAAQLECTAGTLAFTERARTGSVGELTGELDWIQTRGRLVSEHVCANVGVCLLNSICPLAVWLGIRL